MLNSEIYFPNLAARSIYSETLRVSATSKSDRFDVTFPPRDRASRLRKRKRKFKSSSRAFLRARSCVFFFQISLQQEERNAPKKEANTLHGRNKECARNYFIPFEIIMIINDLNRCVYNGKHLYRAHLERNVNSARVRDASDLCRES